MSKGVLVDITKCVGCGSCNVACKLWNDLEFEENNPLTGANAILKDVNWTVVKLYEVNKSSDKVWRFVKNQCFHCKEPACVSACFARALQKRPDGPVIYYKNLCVGCRYCMLACPFDIPKYEWDKAFPLISKCQMCNTRVEAGDSPACVGACPTGALAYGDYDEMLRQAKYRVENDDKYVNHIFGEKEAGGTRWLYISDIPFEQLGFRTDVPFKPLPEYSYDFLKYTPYVIAGWGTLLTGMYIYTKRRNEINKEGKGDESI
ncbi:MAG: 4Fe-4S dicluster domain-containing protein [Firmicutes bacterium]|nr:4Fe-4S dicluster domain-containing protein [Bacillota bacterium]